MNLQRTLLRLMLLTLGIAAAVGVVAIFFSTGVMGRVALTALVGGVCIGLAIPVSKLLDSEKSRAGGLLGLSSIVLALVTFLAAIWIRLFASWDTEIQLTLTGLLVLIGGMLGGFLLPFASRTGVHWASRAAVAADLATMAFLASAIWFDSDPIQEQLAQTGGHIGGSGAAIALCLIGLGTSMRLWQWAGVLGGLAQVCLGLLGTWVVQSDDPTWYVIAAALSVVVGHANVITRVPAGDSGIWAKLASIGGMASAGVAIILLCVVTEGFHGSEPEMLTRLLGASGIVAACGTMAVLVMYRLNKRPPGGGETVAQIAGVQVVCPNCGRKRTAPIGESACDTCGLLLAIQVREPRCVTCDYLLMGVKGGKCPECGTQIPHR